MSEYIRILKNNKNQSFPVLLPSKCFNLSGVTAPWQAINYKGFLGFSIFSLSFRRQGKEKRKKRKKCWDVRLYSPPGFCVFNEEGSSKNTILNLGCELWTISHAPKCVKRWTGGAVWTLYKHKHPQNQCCGTCYPVSCVSLLQWSPGTRYCGNEQASMAGTGVWVSVYTEYGVCVHVCAHISCMLTVNLCVSVCLCVRFGLVFVCSLAGGRMEGVRGSL